MNVLGYIIPAVRELRAPLVGGYLWLLSAWLNFGHRVPESVDSSDNSPWRQLTRLDSALGATGLLVAVSVAAVLIGSLVGELITGVISSRWEQPDAVGIIGASVPEAQYSADRAAATFAEAELRLHVALPLAVVGLSVLLRDEVGVGGALLVFSGLLGWHGFRLLGRWKKQADAVRALVAGRQAEMSVGERLARQADLRLETLPTDPKGTAQLVLRNIGQASARDVDIRDPDSEDPPPFIVEGFLPVDEIRPDESVTIPVFRSLADANVVVVQLRWIDSTGEHEEDRTLRFS